MTTRKRLDVLRQLTVERPCSEDWAAMPGDEKVRFCEKCHHEVHDLSAMTAGEARTLLRERRPDVRLCVRFAQDETGAVVTRTERARRSLLRAGAAVTISAAASLSACRDRVGHEDLASAQADATGSLPRPREPWVALGTVAPELGQVPIATHDSNAQDAGASRDAGLARPPHATSRPTIVGRLPMKRLPKTQGAAIRRRSEEADQGPIQGMLDESD